ncbi:DNA translocase FtsK [Cytobacillus massiliigabonensis]|uniref:DNA translocase FtsK n=1 Tax=Cytobacillus massiliigabonensis TaxID=1871011 RepID=UPI000C848AF6|nr:DNA translocase FtsK [Cytobacillus massiliigabonensis]
MFKNDEEDYRDDEIQEFTDHQPVNRQYETSKDIDAKIVYQYPKGQFRFPLIPDEPKNREPRGRQANKKEPLESRAASGSFSPPNQPPKMTKEKSESVKKRGPFRPTEIPSPIYGFDRPKMKTKIIEQEDQEPIEYELNNALKMEDAFAVEEIDVCENNDRPIHPQDPAENKIDLFSIQEDDHSEILLEEPVQEMEEIYPISGEVKVTEEVTEDIRHYAENQESMEEEEIPVSPGRKHIPFNVIMLNQDKKNLAEKMIPVKSGLEIKRPVPGKAVPVLPADQQMIQDEEITYYKFPSKTLLASAVYQEESSEWIKEQEQLLNSTLKNFNVHAKVVNITQGPSVTRYEVQPEPGVKVNKITNLSDDIKLSLAARDIRIEAPIPGKHTIGIEVPNKKSRPVFISEIINSPEFRDSTSPLTAVLGLDIAGNPIVTDLRKMPHGLIAGATGSGKSVCINSILVSLLYKATPDELKLILIDPKMVELAPYNRIPHLVSPVITDVKAATAALKWAVEEMERRYELFAHAGVRDINRFNELAMEHKRYADKLPFMVIIIDELADLMMMSPADVEEAICRIAQKARACGIHLIIATQRPSVDVITGLIKANVPTRIAFSVSSQIDSRTIIDISGAEKLLGRGDMLFLENGSSKPVRLQGTYVSDNEIDDVVAHVRKEREPEYLFEQEELLKKAQVIEEEDELFYEACEFVVDQGSASTSSLQRRFKIGYNRAARLIDMMEKQGMISEARGSKPRDVLITEADLESVQGTSTIN